MVATRTGEEGVVDQQKVQLESKFKYLTEGTSHEAVAKQDGLDSYEAKIGLQVGFISIHQYLDLH